MTQARMRAAAADGGAAAFGMTRTLAAVRILLVGWLLLASTLPVEADEAAGVTAEVSPAAEAAQPTPAGASAPTADELVMLRSIGFNEAQILAELEPLRGQVAYGEAALATLREAGFSADFIAAIMALAPTPRLDNAAVAAMLDEGMAARTILERIAAAETEFDTSARAMLALGQGRDIPVVVTKAMLGAPLTEADLHLLAEEDVPAEDQQALIALVGAELEIATPSAALELAQAGVPAEVLAMLREETPTEEGLLEADEVAETGEAEGPALVGEDEVAAAPGLDPESLARFEHVTNLFGLAYPREWFFSRVWDGGSTVYQATLERPRGEQVALDTGMTGLTLRVWPRDRLREGEAVDPVELIGSGLSRLYGHRLASLEAMGEAQPLTIDDRAAAYRDYAAEVDGAAIAFRWYVAVGEDHFIGVMAHAPEARFAEHEPTFAALAGAMTFPGSAFAERRTGAAFTSSELAQRYRHAVVAVLVSDDGDNWVGGGSGFFVRSDGYLLTNHHVVWNAQEKRPWRHFLVRWSTELERDDIDAELIAYRYSESRAVELAGASQYLNVGEDLALLKVSGIERYDTIPLAPLDRTEVGDPVITMGFPIITQFDRRHSTTISSGVVTRFNRDVDDRIETIVTDAKFAPGNSGGPAISLVTGGVIGLNTRAPDALMAQAEDRNVRHEIGYYAIMPIDRAIEHFPQATSVTAERDRRIDAYDAFDLAQFAFDKGWRAGAVALAERAVERAPASPASRHLLARILLTPHPDRTDDDLAEGERELEAALALDPAFQEALYTKIDHEIDREEYLEAIKAANRALEVEETWIAHTKRARIYRLMDQPEDALADLEQAKALGGEATVEPYLLAGAIHYEGEDFEAGRAEYEAALGISPGNVQARLGVGRYYLLTERYLAALLEFDALLEDEPEHPETHAAIARAYAGQGNHERAVTYYTRAINFYQREQRTPPEPVLREAAASAADELLDRPRATNLYAAYLGHYYDSRDTLAGHRYLAAGAEDHPAIRRAHLARAIALKGNVQDDERSELEESMKEVANARLALDDVRQMRELTYPRRLIVPLIRDNPGNYALAGTTDAEGNIDQARQQAWNELNREFGFDIAVAIYGKVREAERAGGAQRDDGQEGADNRDGPVPLAGTWFRQSDDGRRAEIELGQDRTYRVVEIRGGQTNVRSQGRWALEREGDNNVLALTYVGRDGREVTSRLPLRVARLDDGDRLYLTQNGREQEYRRAEG